MNMKPLAFFLTIIFMGSLMSASAATYTGTDLAGMTYPAAVNGTAQYVAAGALTPFDPAAELVLNANGTNGNSDLASVYAPGSSFGILTLFTATMTENQAGPAGSGNFPYWDILLQDPNSAGTVEVQAFSGDTWTTAGGYHTPSGDFGFGSNLVTVETTTVNGTQLGTWDVIAAGIDIGWSGARASTVTADIFSITVPGLSQVPEPSTWAAAALLAGFCVVSAARRHRSNLKA